MSNFNYAVELQKIIDTKQLVELHHVDGGSYRVAYLINANDEFLTFADLNPTATQAAVGICRLTDIEVIKVESIYLSEFAKKITDDSLQLQIAKQIEGIKDFSFEGFFSGLEDTGTIVSIATKLEDPFAGRIVGHDDKVVVLDEFYTENDRRYARAYIFQENIMVIALGVAWLNTIARAVADRRL